MSRKDMWTSKEDQILKDTVLKSISIGRTQLKAFEIVGERTGRTAAACGFRWNKELRYSYEKEVKEARQQAKKRFGNRVSRSNSSDFRALPAIKEVTKYGFDTDYLEKGGVYHADFTTTYIDLESYNGPVAVTNVSQDELKIMKIYPDGLTEHLTILASSLNNGSIKIHEFKRMS